MTVTAQVIDVQVSAEVNSAAVTVNVQIGNGGEVTTEVVHEALGISDDGSATKFLNEQGDFIEIEAGAPGAPGATGKSAYQSYLDTTSDNPVLTEQQWSNQLAGVLTILNSI